MTPRSEREILELAAKDRAERDQRDARWLARQRRRHRQLALFGGVLTAVFYALAAWVGTFHLGAWILLTLGGCLAAFLMSRFHLNILTGCACWVGTLVSATLLCQALGWWHIPPIECFILAMSFGFLLMIAGMIAVHLDGRDA